jgi:arylsulfatase A-like enzyme
MRTSSFRGVWSHLFCATLLIVAAGLISFPSAQAQEVRVVPGTPRKPSIIFILADDLGYGDLGCYGQTQIKTPNIDKLAADGMRFTSFYAGSTVCAPSRCALMTGLHTGHGRIRGNANISLEPEDQTVAEFLKGVGYFTGAFGKWGLGDARTPGIPSKKGFDEWFGYLDQVEAHNYYPAFLNRSDSKTNVQMEIAENVRGKKGLYSDDYFTRAALNFIRIHEPDPVNHQRPFFLYLPYTIPHANNELGEQTGNGMEVPFDPTSPYTSQPWPEVEKNKALMITRLDRYVAMIREKLKEMNIEQNTIIIFASDNGAHKEGGVDPKFFQSTGRLRGIKRDLYEGGIRVPFIVCWPARIKPGTTCDIPFAFWDFLPTVAELAYQDAPTNIDGISFAPTLVGDPQMKGHEFLYWEFHEGGFKQAVRMGDWKAVRYGIDGPLELYNLKVDLAEKTDVAQDHPDIVAKIEAYLKTARTDDPNWPTKTAAETSKKEYGK